MERNKENVQSLIDQDYTIRQLAKVFGITETPMRMWLNKNGLKTNHIRPFRRWTDQQLIDAVRDSIFMSDVIKKLGLTVRPGNYSHLKIHINRLGLSTEHMNGNNITHLHRGGMPKKYTNEEVFVANSTYSRHNIKARIVKQSLIKYECDICGLSKWLEKKLVLILDHKNGINDDHRLSNLRFLCPNCNSQQSTFCRKSKSS